MFEEWLTCDIIEEVLETENDVGSQYLSYRLVFKGNPTTSVRPVFNASSTKDFFYLLMTVWQKVKKSFQVNYRFPS